MARDCEHGQLARSCEVCDLRARVSELEQERDELREALGLACDELCANIDCCECLQRCPALELKYDATSDDCVNKVNRNGLIDHYVTAARERCGDEKGHLRRLCTLWNTRF